MEVLRQFNEVHSVIKFTSGENEGKMVFLDVLLITRADGLIRNLNR